MVGGKLIESYLPMKGGGGGIDSHGFFRLIHSTCIFAYHELSLRSMLILVQTVQKGDITKGGGGAAYSVRSIYRCITQNIF